MISDGQWDSVFVVERVHNISRETALKPSESKSEDRIPLTITYHPNNLRVKDIILKNFKLLQSDPDTARMKAVHNSRPHSDLLYGTQCSKARANLRLNPSHSFVSLVLKAFSLLN